MEHRPKQPSALDGALLLALGAVIVVVTYVYVSPLSDVRKRPGENGRFDVTVIPPDGERLVLSLLDRGRGESIDYCLLKLDPLVARPGQS